MQTRVRSDLDGQWEQIEKKSAEIKAKADANRQDWTLAEFTSVFTDIGNIYLAGRKAQVNALNIQRFSEEEYEWVRMRIYEAAGVQLAGGIDLSTIEGLARENAGKSGVEIPKMRSARGPEEESRPRQASRREAEGMAANGLPRALALSER